MRRPVKKQMRSVTHAQWRVDSEQQRGHPNRVRYQVELGGFSFTLHAKHYIGNHRGNCTSRAPDCISNHRMDKDIH